MEWTKRGINVTPAYRPWHRLHRRRLRLVHTGSRHRRLSTNRPASGAVQCVWPWSPGWRADRVGVGPTAAGRPATLGGSARLDRSSQSPPGCRTGDISSLRGGDGPADGVSDVRYSVHEEPLPDSGEKEGRRMLPWSRPAPDHSVLSHPGLNCLDLCGLSCHELLLPSAASQTGLCSTHDPGANLIRL